MIAEATLSPETAAFTQLRNPSIDAAVTIPITLNVAEMRLELPIQSRYLSVVENYDHPIIFTLHGGGSEAFFDNPGIVFLNPPSFFTSGSLQRVTSTRLELHWSNVHLADRGRSFDYRIFVVVRVNGFLVPVTHDPTVHNDPPTI
ncbi:MAG TPA: hypothetical protein VEK79_15240 [Thermoanaerobaculia bacterium]|nr:hypothetical protein [Thermoanaerobaculia bacterium]